MQIVRCSCELILPANYKVGIFSQTSAIFGPFPRPIRPSLPRPALSANFLCFTDDDRRRLQSGVSSGSRKFGRRREKSKQTVSGTSFCRCFQIWRWILLRATAETMDSGWDMTKETWTSSSSLSCQRSVVCEIFCKSFFQNIAHNLGKLKLNCKCWQRWANPDSESWADLGRGWVCSPTLVKGRVKCQMMKPASLKI